MTRAEADLVADAGSSVADAKERAALSRPDLQVALLAFGLLALAVGLLLVIPDIGDSTSPAGVWAFVVVSVLFGLFEYKVFNVEFGNQGIAFSLSEVPLALALVFLPPPVAILARASLSFPALAFLRRNRGVKLLFNSALFVFEVALAFAIHRGLLELWGSSDAAVIVTVAIAVAATPTITSIAISLAISRYEGSAREQVARELAASWWLYPFNSVIPAMTVALALIEPALALIAALPIAGTWYVLNSYGKLKQELRDLDLLQGFTGRIGASLDVQEICDLAIDEVSSRVRGAGVALVRFDGNDAIATERGSVGLLLPTTPSDERWAELPRTGGGCLLNYRELRSCGLLMSGDDRQPRLFARLNDHEQDLGFLVVTQRQLIGTEFDVDDATRLGHIAGQLAVSLRRGVLHERLEWEARHDALTELPARTLFELYVDEATQSSGTGVWTVMMLDLDRFKEVNDTLGHHAGDALLIEFSRRMRAILAPDDRLARLAGDEFAILCHRDRPEEVVELAQACVREGGRPVTLDGLEIVVTVSVGVAEIDAMDDKAIQPMRRADIAMYNAKWQRTGVEFYRDEIDRRTPARLSMLGDLRAAIESDQLTVVYQPKLSLSTGAVVGAEALVRWDHPTRGTVPPSEFVRVAEDTGLIKQLTDLVLASGIRMLAEIQGEGLDVGLSVNLSTHDLFDARLPERVNGYLDEHGVDPAQLTLEITESSLFVDAPRTRATIDGLYDVGLRMAVDDFGTGYSSLSYLRRLPVHELKIDQSFVAGMLVDPQDEVIVRSTVDLGHNLGLLVVAEGVESFEILERLREIGCDVAQGYAISEPILSTEIIGWLHRTAGRAWQSALD